MTDQELLPALAELVALIPPPTDPVRVEGDWATFAEVNGFDPPTEWMALLSRYGLGSIGGEAVQLLDPFPAGSSFAVNGEWQRSYLRRFIREEAATSHWGVWPDPGGFLPWADLRDGSGEIGWLTNGPSDTWRVAVFDRGGDHTATELGTLDYLLHLARHAGEEMSAPGVSGWMDELTFHAYRPYVDLQATTHGEVEVEFGEQPYEGPGADLLGSTYGACPTVDPETLNEQLARTFDWASGVGPAETDWFERAPSPLSPTALRRLQAEGLSILGVGYSSERAGYARVQLSIRYSLGQEERTRAALVDAAVATGAPIAVIRTPAGDLIWSDLCGAD